MSIGKSRVVGTTVKSRIKTSKKGKEERHKLEMLVELGGESSPFSVVDAIPMGACNVLVSGRVIEEITVVGLGDPATDVGLDTAAVVSTDYFGAVDGSEGDTFTPADMDDGLSSGVGVLLVFAGETGDITFTAGADFVTGSVRLAIFYTLVGGSDEVMSIQLDEVERAALEAVFEAFNAAGLRRRQVVREVIQRHGGDPERVILEVVDIGTGEAVLRAREAPQAAPIPKILVPEVRVVGEQGR